MNEQELKDVRKAFDRDLRQLIGVKVHDYAVAYKSGFDNARASQWIPVSERLPEEEAVYLGTGADGLTKVAYFAGGKLTPALSDLETIIAWMPLPKPYQPSTQDKVAASFQKILPKHGLADCLHKDEGMVKHES